MKWIWASLVYLASLALIAAICFGIVMVFAGPHSDLLPGFLRIPLFIAGWLTVLILPFYLAWRTYKRLNQSPHSLMHRKSL